MPIVFEKSAIASMFTRLFCALISLIVGVSFGALSLLVPDLPIVVKIGSGLAVIGSVWMVLKLVGEAFKIYQRGDSWRVEISKQYLMWYSPVPEIMQSFQLPLDQIKSVNRVCFLAKNSKTSPINKYYIELTNGRSVEINDQVSGIAPRKVFKALDELGIPFQEEIRRHGAGLKVEF